MPIKPTVFVVDDDKSTRESICALVQSMGIDAEAHASAEEFLEDHDEGRAGCLVTDVRMLGMSGLELQEKLADRGSPLPVVILTAYARTPLTVRAMERGAVTVLEKPYEEDDLWDAIRRALTRNTASRAEHGRRQELRDRLALLSPPQRQVMDMMVQGRPNKQIAEDLVVSLRTIEHRRSQIFSKMQAGSLAELVRFVIEADIEE